MRKQHIFSKVSSILILMTTMLSFAIFSCDDDDFRIIPEPQENQVISSVEPSFGDIGSMITIIGVNFSPVPSNNRVSFNGIRASVSSATKTELKVTVPEGATTGPISVGKIITVEGPVFSIVSAPQITEVNVIGAAVGETIIISGANFGATISDNTVSFNGTEAEIVSASNTEIIVIVPEGATTGPLTVEVMGQIGTLEVFNIAPEIISFNPESGIANDEITITGTNFNTDPNINNVSFNGVLATVISATTTELVVSVPADASTGKIAVEIESLLATSENDFITVPSIEAFTPEVGASGIEITITGANFSTTPGDNTVSFNGVSAVVTQSTTTSITTSVPDGSETGPITVEVNGQLATSTNDFMVDNSIVTITIPINDVNDDVEEAEDGRMLLESGDLELGEFDTFSTPDVGLQKIGLRFNNIVIPIGATIQEAKIIFVADQTEGANPTEMTIFGENIGNASPYTEDIGNLSARSLTTANSVWNIPEWIGTDTPIDDRTTVDISSIINEIITRGDWANGNSLNFIFQATGVSAGATENNVGREAETYDIDNPQEGAQLLITYMIN
ncbi:IPT/TIG domain-containing protein [Aquimarina sp. 2201CG14-23]|uniref:IPT/TIG domain-containing protein n=1 Tax=Aquimarina mycalae TaxID=3040073 RepID=UPI0024781AC3|nr:IPT/TIG domain-containing protein [Aquimarina sp. 2201CG14-23]MDH7445617.1 IPT/TIG domain-containing protein [Aquimarina sp. 2201CG14-23]